MLSKPKFCLLSAEIFTPLTGSFRQTRWASYFTKLDYDLDILYTPYSGKLVIEPINSLNSIQSIKEKYLLNNIPKAGVRSGNLASIFRYLKHSFLVDIIDVRNILIYFKIKNYIESTPGKIIFHCSSPPFYLAVITFFLKKKFSDKIFFWLDMRDLWSLHKGIPGFKFHKQIIEAIVLKKVDLLSTVADSLAHRFETTFKKPTEVAYNVATQIDFSLFTKNKLDLYSVDKRIEVNKKLITYTGSLPKNYYDLDSFASFLFELDNIIQITANYQFIFLGECNELRHRLKDKLKNLSVIFITQKMHKEVQILQYNSEILLFFGFNSPDNQGQMSTKLFEYLETGNSILPIFVNSTSDISKVISLYCEYMLHLNDYFGLYNVLKLYLLNNEVLPRLKNINAKEILLEDYKRIVDLIQVKFSDTVYE